MNDNPDQRGLGAQPTAENWEGHSKIILPDTDMGPWACLVCWHVGGRMHDGLAPEDVECVRRERPDDWDSKFIYG